MSSKELYVGCPVQHARQFLSGKWQIGILWHLKMQPARFIDLRNILPGISEKVLTQELRFFEKSGIIEKEVSANIPLRAEYRLTMQGLTLIPVIQSIVQWSYANLQEEKVKRSMSSTPVSVINELETMQGPKNEC